MAFLGRIAGKPKKKAGTLLKGARLKSKVSTRRGEYPPIYLRSFPFCLTTR